MRSVKSNAIVTLMAESAYALRILIVVGCGLRRSGGSIMGSNEDAAGVGYCWGLAIMMIV
jgi:hypothetical protein